MVNTGQCHCCGSRFRFNRSWPGAAQSSPSSRQVLAVHSLSTRWRLKNCRKSRYSISRAPTQRFGTRCKSRAESPAMHHYVVFDLASHWRCPCSGTDISMPFIPARRTSTLPSKLGATHEHGVRQPPQAPHHTHRMRKKGERRKGILVRHHKLKKANNWNHQPKEKKRKDSLWCILESFHDLLLPSTLAFFPSREKHSFHECNFYMQILFIASVHLTEPNPKRMNSQMSEKLVWNGTQLPFTIHHSWKPLYYNTCTQTKNKTCF